MELTAESVKQFAKSCGADLAGIGDINRFEGAPPENDPRYINPEAKTIIGLGFRIFRGDLRGIEEGTQFYQYPAMNYANINEVYAPIVLRQLAAFIEDHGYEANNIRNYGSVNTISDITNDPDEPAEYGRRLKYSRPVRDGQPAPDIYLHFRLAAFICGMGEIGFSKVFLTPEFGPRQRFAFMLTDAELEPDPIYDGPALCNRCMACVRECPGNAIKEDQTVKVTVAGRELEWSDIDAWSCFGYYVSPVENVNPFLPPDALADMPDGDAIRRGEKPLSPEEALELQGRMGRYYPRPSGYFPAMCGGRGCIRACMVSLEQRKALKNEFKQPFRRRPKWWG